MRKLIFEYLDGGKSIVTGKGKEATDEQRKKFSKSFVNAAVAIYQRYPKKEFEPVYLWRKKMGRVISNIIAEFDKTYEQYQGFIKDKEWNEAATAEGYLVGLAYCIKTICTEKEIEKSVKIEAVKRVNLICGILK